jgi:hypothetical protein
VNIRDEQRQLAAIVHAIVGDASTMPPIEQIEQMVPAAFDALAAWAQSDGQDGPWAALFRAVKPEREAVVRVLLLAARSVKANEGAWNPPSPIEPTGFPVRARVRLPEPLHLRRPEGPLAFVCGAATIGAWFVREPSSFLASDNVCPACCSATAGGGP